MWINTGVHIQTFEMVSKNSIIKKKLSRRGALYQNAVTKCLGEERRLEFPARNGLSRDKLQKAAFPRCQHQPAWLCPQAANRSKYIAEQETERSSKTLNNIHPL